jgi:hypothetical protein
LLTDVACWLQDALLQRLSVRRITVKQAGRATSGAETYDKQMGREEAIANRDAISKVRGPAQAGVHVRSDRLGVRSGAVQLAV